MRNEKYKKETPISEGLTGSVYKGFNNETKEKVAIKIISKNNKKISQDRLKHYINEEVNTMKKCESENSVKLLDFFEEDDNYFIIMELCDKSLFAYLRNRRTFSPQEIYEIFSGLNKTFKIMCENKISHRDIKLENILIKYIDEGKTKFIPKLCDYGFSKQIEQESKNTKVGTKSTIAPEVYFKGIYGPEADLWSIGVILYLCNFKDYPYNYKNLGQIMKNNKLEYKKPDNYFLADLIDRLLVVDPKNRMTWEQYFNHPFFKYSSLTEYNIGLQNNNLKYYKAKYQEKDVLLKEMKQDNLDANFNRIDYKINEELIKDENILKQISTEEFKDEKGKKVIYFIYEFDEKLRLLNKKQFEILIDNLLKKYETINNYYNMVNIDNLDFIYENEDFIFLTLYEIEIIKKIFSDENEFNKNEHEISFLTILMEENTFNILKQNFFILNSKKCFDIKLFNNPLSEEKKNKFIAEITKIYDNLLKIVLEIKKTTNSDNYSPIFNKINDNFLEDFVKDFGNSNFCQFFFSFIQKFNENREGENFDYKNAYVELNLLKYIAEFLLMFKESIESINYSPFNNSKEIIYTKINEIFEDEENKEKFILINIFSAKIRNVINNLNEMDDKKNVLKEDNKEAFEKLIEFYPYIIKLINYAKQKLN